MSQTKFVVCWKATRIIDSEYLGYKMQKEESEDQRRYFESVEDAIEFIANAPEKLRPSMEMKECY